MNQITNQRDKMVIIALTILGIGCLVGILFASQGGQLITPFSMIIGIFATMYKGNASPPDTSKTTETTVSSTNTQPLHANPPGSPALSPRGATDSDNLLPGGNYQSGEPK